MFDLIKEFSIGLMEEAGFGNLPPNEKKMYEQKIIDLATQKIGTEILKSMNDDDQNEYFNLLENNPTQIQIFDFFSQRIPDLDQFVITILRNFRKEFLTQITH